MNKLPEKVVKLMEKQNIEKNADKRAKKIKKNISLFGKNSFVNQKELKRFLMELRGDSYE